MLRRVDVIGRYCGQRKIESGVFEVVPLEVLKMLSRGMIRGEDLGMRTIGR